MAKAKAPVSKRFRLNKDEGKKVLVVFGWTVASAVIALALDLVNLIEVPVEYVFIVPVINNVLYVLKEFAKGQA